MADLPLRCACGKLKGTVALSADSGVHVVCYCKDCQAFARFLGRTDITDQWGGTDIFQMAPSRVRITEGADAIRCVRLSEKGMHRWYCGECKTPIGNTLGPKLPFVGLISAIVDYKAAGVAIDDVLGKPIAYGFPEAAIGGPPPHTKHNPKLKFLGKVTAFLAKWWLTNAGWPSPFFDETTRQPRAAVQVLSTEERAKL